MKSFNLLLSAAAIAIAIGLPAKAFGQTTSTTVSQNPYTVTFEDLPSMENFGSVGLQSTWLILHSLYGEYEWGSGKEWAFGGKVSAGIPLFYTLANSERGNPLIGQIELHSKWYFNRLSRTRNGYTLRKNSGFFFEQGLGLLAGVVLGEITSYPGNDNEFRSMGYGQLSIGYHYVTRKHFSFSSQLGLALFPSQHFAPIPLLDLKIGYAF